MGLMAFPGPWALGPLGPHGPPWASEAPYRSQVDVVDVRIGVPNVGLTIRNCDGTWENEFPQFNCDLRAGGSEFHEFRIRIF